MTVIADTGAIYALVDASDRWHVPVVEWWGSNRTEVLIPEVALPEICYLLSTRIGAQAESAFVASLASGELEITALAAGDIERAGEVIAEYEDLKLGFVDAAIVAIAERLESRHLLATDRRHFGIIRPRHARSFVLLPNRPPGR